MGSRRTKKIRLNGVRWGLQQGLLMAQPLKMTERGDGVVWKSLKRRHQLTLAKVRTLAFQTGFWDILVEGQKEAIYSRRRVRNEKHVGGVEY